MRKRSKLRTAGARLWVGVLVLGLAWGFWGRPAHALPSFARQTGQPCAACHLGYPQLTPFGRAFKLNGYVWKGGKSELPHIAFMLVPTFTHTEKGQPGGAAPDFGPNDNLALQETSVFYGGALYSDIGLGAFAQLTYDGGEHRFGWDNTDVRLAHTVTLGDNSFVLGLDANNNPSVQDLWNTTPAWRFPFSGSGFAPGPAAATLIEGGLEQQVAGLGGYMKWNDLIYAGVSGYRTLSKHTQLVLGVDTTDVNSIDGIAPYWRLALTPSWGKNSLEVGAFGLSANLYPGRFKGAGVDKFQDVGVDAQYQFIGERDGITLAGSWIHENQDWNASYMSGDTANAHDGLNSFNIRASYLYNQTVGATVGYFNVYGGKDTGLYAPDPIDGSLNGSPDSDGWIFQIDYMPFNKGGPSFWPWLNAKIGLQYVVYNKFNGRSSNYDGFGRSASDNNTLFLFAWIAF